MECTTAKTILKMVLPLNMKDPKPIYFKETEDESWILTQPEKNEVFVETEEIEYQTINEIKFKNSTLLKLEPKHAT